MDWLEKALRYDMKHCPEMYESLGHPRRVDSLATNQSPLKEITMSATQTITVPVEIQPNVPVGKTTVGGTLFAVLAAVAAVYAGVEGNDVATATGGIVAILAALRVLGGRYAQAVAQIEAIAPAIEHVAHDVSKPAAEA